MMTSEFSRKLIQEVCTNFLRYWGDIQEEFPKHFSNLQRLERERLKKEVKEKEKRIQQLNKRIEDLKSKFKETKESQLKKQMESMKTNLKEESNQLKEIKKELSKISKRFDQLKTEYENSLKMLQKYLLDLKKIDLKHSKPGKAVETILIFIPKLAEEFKMLNELAGIDEFMEIYTFRFSLKHVYGTVSVKSELEFMALLLESMAFNLLHVVNYHENITSRKEELLARALSAAKGSLELVKKTDNEPLKRFYEKMVILFEMEYLKILGIQEFEAHDYRTATSYFREALSYVKKIKDEKAFANYLEEQALLLQALASDAFNLVYLLNSYKNWSYLEQITSNEILKELASITKDRIEDFITPMYGFPQDKQLELITDPRVVEWPKPIRSPKLDQIVPMFQ
ncbi:MAG: hypothetical protein ACXQS8_01010 [Candidatus Helarchaeales archaeon]